MSKVFQIYGAYYIAPNAKGYETQSSAHVDAMAITERDLWRNDAMLLVEEKDALRAEAAQLREALSTFHWAYGRLMKGDPDEMGDAIKKAREVLGVDTW